MSHNYVKPSRKQAFNKLLQMRNFPTGAQVPELSPWAPGIGHPPAPRAPSAPPSLRGEGRTPLGCDLPEPGQLHSGYPSRRAGSLQVLRLLPRTCAPSLTQPCSGMLSPAPSSPHLRTLSRSALCQAWRPGSPCF